MDFINETERTGSHEFVVFLNAKDLFEIIYNVSTNKIFEGNDSLEQISIKEMTMEYLHDDVNILLPTGLFYVI